MRRHGFTLLELAIVIVILAIVLAIGYGSLSRYRANLALTQAVERMAAELSNTKGQAQAFGLPHLRNGQPLPSPLPVSGTQAPGENPLMARIVEKVYGQSAPQIKKQWSIGDTAGTSRRLQVRFANLPLVPLGLNAADQGVSLEVVQQPNTVLATVAFESDGRPRLLNEQVSGAIYLALGADSTLPEFEIEISPLGAVAKKKIR